MFNAIAKSLTAPLAALNALGASPQAAASSSPAEGSSQPRMTLDTWSGTLQAIDIARGNPNGSGGTSGRSNNRKGNISI